MTALAQNGSQVRSGLLVAAVLASLAGCGASEPAEDGCDAGLEPLREIADGGGTDARRYRLDSLSVGAAAPAGSPNVVPGFDLDSRVSDETDALGCGHVDFESPAPESTPGVDNQMGPLLSSVGMLVGVEESTDRAMASGELVVELWLSDVDAEGFVRVTLVSDGESFELDGRVEDGVLTAWGPALELWLATTTEPLELSMEAVQLRAEVGDAGLSRGVLGGSLEVDAMAEVLRNLIEDDWGGAFLRGAVEDQADLCAEEAGRCRRISIAVVFDARRM